MTTDVATLDAPLEQADIRLLIPHGGTMCLLDRVIRWNDLEVECTTESHRALDNPLRHGGVLPVHVGIEYCAQAIAIHGRVARKETGAPRRGYLVVILNTQWHTQRLDEYAGALHVSAKKQVVLQQGVHYAFAIQHEGHTLLSGQAVVALE